MAISFLPPSQILANTRLQLQATTEPLQKFVEYVDGNWVQNTTWPPSCWSLNKQWASSPIMTWQWEGWHNGLKKCASGRAQMPLYMLVHLLHKEAYLVAYQIRLVSKRKLTKLQKNITTPSKRKYQATGSNMPSTKSQQLNYSKLVPMSMDQ